MNEPYHEPSKTEHPSRTAYFERLMAEVEPVQAPPLELARRRLERLEAKRDAIEKEAEETGTDYELDWSDQWHELLGDIESARAEVARLEKEAIQ